MGKRILVVDDEKSIVDILKLNLGNQVVTDSLIQEGTVEVNESFITGDGWAYDDEEADAAIVKLAEAYTKYKAEHGPILDEKGNDIFPDEE